MPYKSRAELIEKLESLGENPPSSWTRNQMIARLAEIEEPSNPLTSMKAAEKELNAVSRNKTSLQQYLRDHGAQLTGMETIPQLLSVGHRLIGERIPGHRSDTLNYGQHANKTYGEMKDTSYAQWTLTTYEESGGAEGTSNWRLKRFAAWLLSEQLQDSIRPHVNLSKKTISSKKETDAGLSSDSSFTKVSLSSTRRSPVMTSQGSQKGYTDPQRPTMTQGAIPPVPDSEEEMISDTETRILELESQLQNLKGSRKREKRVETQATPTSEEQ